MKTMKVFSRLFGVLTLLSLTLILNVSPSVSQGNIPTPAGPLTTSGLPAANAPQGGGPVPGGPGYVILNGFDFKPLDQAAGYHYSGSLLQNSGTGYAYYLAPVHLPQGATINQVVAYYLDNDSGTSLDVEVKLLQTYDFSNSGVFIATVVSSGAILGITYNVTSSITTPLVDNATYSYAVQVGMANSASLGLQAVRIDYNYPVSLPLVSK
jgi:hypothetical protein